MSKILFYHSENNVQNNVKFVSLYHHVTITLDLIYIAFISLHSVTSFLWFFMMFCSDRPSVNSILKKPFIQKRIEKFLSQEVSCWFRSKLILLVKCPYHWWVILIWLHFPSFQSLLVFCTGNFQNNFWLEHPPLLKFPVEPCPDYCNSYQLQWQSS